MKQGDGKQGDRGNRSYEAGDWRRGQETEYGIPESLRQEMGYKRKRRQEIEEGSLH